MYFKLLMTSIRIDDKKVLKFILKKSKLIFYLSLILFFLINSFFYSYKLKKLDYTHFTFIKILKLQIM